MTTTPNPSGKTTLKREVLKQIYQSLNTWFNAPHNTPETPLTVRIMVPEEGFAIPDMVTIEADAYTQFRPHYDRSKLANVHTVISIPHTESDHLKNTFPLAGNVMEIHELLSALVRKAGLSLPSSSDIIEAEMRETPVHAKRTVPTIHSDSFLGNGIHLVANRFILTFHIKDKGKLRRAAADMLKELDQPRLR